MQFRKRALTKAILIVLISLGSVGSSPGEEPDHFVPVKKNLDAAWVKSLTERGERKVYRGEELETIGMPCGGICAGQIYVRGDGTLAHWWIANNAQNTGYGANMECDTPLGVFQQAYQTHRPESPIDQGFAIRVEQEGAPATVRTLDRDGFDNIGFIGEYPIAEIQYETKKGKKPFPVSVSAEIFSPFIPLNARDSATPVTILRYSLRNRSDKSVEVAVAGWLQNPVCLDLRGRVAGLSRNRVAAGAGMTSVQFDLIEAPQQKREKRREIIFEDFESGDYAKWTIEGDAFGSGPATGTLPTQQNVSGFEGKYLVNTFLGRDESKGKLTSKPFKVKEKFITFLMGGGNHPGCCCMNLIIDEKIVRSSTGSSNERLEPDYWDVAEFVGQQARLEIYDCFQGPWGHINVDRIAFSNLPPDFLTAFPSDYPQFGQMALSALDPKAEATATWAGVDAFGKNGRLAKVQNNEYPLGEKECGAVASTLKLEPGEEGDLVFLVSWYFPQRRQDNRGQGLGRPVGVGQAVGNQYANWYDSALDVASYVKKNFARLDGETHRFRDAYYKETTLPYWFVQRVAAPASILATETCQWWKNGRFWAWEGVGCCSGTCTHVWNYEHAVARLFPELNRSARELQDLGPAYDESTGKVGFRGNRNVAFDGQAGTVLKVYREHQMSTDDAFLKRTWPRAKGALQFLIDQDKNDDGLIEVSQHNTFDINFLGPNTFVGSLYLAALRAGEEMALRMGDDAFAKRARAIFEAGRAGTMERLWNGEYFIQELNAEPMPRFQYLDGCLSDQVFGQGWAHQVGLGRVYPEKETRSALGAVWKYNWAPNIAPQNEAHPPERWFARPGEPGLFICTWPKSKHLGNDGVRYRDEVWTGIEYQVAGHMLYEEMTREGLAIIRGVHDRYDGAKHNPWNEIECGDHYSRAMASWGCLLGVTGFLYDGPAGKIGFAPRLSPNDFAAFFTAAEGWGRLIQKGIGKSRVNRIELKWGQLRIKTVVLELDPAVAKPKKITVKAAGNIIDATSAVEDGRLTITLKKEQILKTGEILEVRIP